MIFYFSATGNSRHVADRIAGEGESVLRMDTALRENRLTHEITDGRLGIITPTYCWSLPAVVEEFLRRAVFSFREKPYVFHIATYGTTTGACGQLADRLLRKQGLGADAFFDIRMPDTWTPIFDLSDPARVAGQNAAADAHIAETRELIELEQHGDFRNDKAPLFTGLIGKVFYDAILRKTARLTVTDACTGCGLCEKKCPVSAIEMRDGRPIWGKDSCEMCLGCLHRCPVFAVQYGRMTEKHGQYVHPAVRVRDL